MLLLGGGQVAKPFVLEKQVGLYSIRILDDKFAGCERCIQNLKKNLHDALQPQVSYIAYSSLKKVLYIKTVNEAEIDTAVVGRVLRETGVRKYEIRF